MSEYDKVCIETFLRDQLKLFPEKVAETPEEAEDFLDMCMAAVCKNMKEVREYFDETGADISGMSKEELEQAMKYSSFRMDDIWWWMPEKHSERRMSIPRFKCVEY